MTATRGRGTQPRFQHPCVPGELADEEKKMEKKCMQEREKEDEQMLIIFLCVNVQTSSY